MSIEQNLATLERARQQWNAGNLEGYLRLYAPDVVLHGYSGVGPGLASVRQFYQGFWSAFPRTQLTFEDVFATADKVACRFVVHATHQCERSHEVYPKGPRFRAYSRSATLWRYGIHVK